VVARTGIGSTRPLGAPAPRTVAESAAATDDAPQRPQLSLVTPATQAPQQVVARSAAERLAAQTGGTIEQGEGGLRTVHFPPPEIAGLSTQQPYTISRELSDAPAAQSAPSESTGVEHPSESAGAAMDPETLYEYFLDRFKRDLLVEREQLGHLIIDNP
jgi:hypothetical protein